MNGEFGDREKVARGLKKKDLPLINDYQLFHSYRHTWHLTVKLGVKHVELRYNEKTSGKP